MLVTSAATVAADTAMVASRALHQMHSDVVSIHVVTLLRYRFNALAVASVFRCVAVLQLLQQPRAELAAAAAAAAAHHSISSGTRPRAFPSIQL
jgi:hypothetical protein